jgi:hypothetical protein
MDWTWARVALLTAALWLQIDAFLVPTRADPGPSGDVALSFAISWVALKKKVPSPVQGLIGCGLTVFACVSNRVNLRGYEFVTLPFLVLGCVLFFYFSKHE